MQPLERGEAAQQVSGMTRRNREERRTDDVECDAAVHCFEVDLLCWLVGDLVELSLHLLSAVSDEARHPVEPPGVESGRDDAAPVTRGGEVRRDEAFAHDGLEDLCEDALVVVCRVLGHDVSHDRGVRDDQKGLWQKADLEDTAIPGLGSSSDRGFRQPWPTNGEQGIRPMEFPDAKIILFQGKCERAGQQKITFGCRPAAAAGNPLGDPQWPERGPAGPPPGKSGSR